VLEPGGRLGISDVVAEDHLTPADRAERGRVLSSQLPGDDEIGELAGVTITFRANQNGGTHAADCRHVSMKAAEAETMSLAAFRAAASEGHPCRECGGGILGPLPAGPGERMEASRNAGKLGSGVCGQGSAPACRDRMATEVR
jgi:arsenite methyltransferase